MSEEWLYSDFKQPYHSTGHNAGDAGGMEASDAESTEALVQPLPNVLLINYVDALGLDLYWSFPLKKPHGFQVPQCFLEWDCMAAWDSQIFTWQWRLCNAPDPCVWAASIQSEFSFRSYIFGSPLQCQA